MVAFVVREQIEIESRFYRAIWGISDLSPGGKAGNQPATKSGNEPVLSGAPHRWQRRPAVFSNARRGGSLLLPGLCCRSFPGFTPVRQTSGAGEGRDKHGFRQNTTPWPSTVTRGLLMILNFYHVSTSFFLQICAC